MVPYLLLLKVTQEHVDRAFTIAHWYGRRTPRAEISDLESAALEGLAKAARDWEPDATPGRRSRRGRRRSFWRFAFIKILGEMKDELRRFDHLTRNQRAMVTEHSNGDLAIDGDELRWINPQEPMSLDATVVGAHGENPSPIVELLEEQRDLIEEFQLRDAFCRAGAELPEQQRFVVVKREIEGFSNTELAEAFDVTEGRASQIRGAALDQMREQIGDSLLDAA